MPKIIVLPSNDDQVLLVNGRRPENHFLHEFATSVELEAYTNGLDAMNDLVEYEIPSDRGLSITIVFDDRPEDITFENEAVKAAYLKGIEDGDGFVRPQSYTEDEPEFAEIMELVSSSPTP